MGEDKVLLRAKGVIEQEETKHHALRKKIRKRTAWNIHWGRGEKVR